MAADDMAGHDREEEEAQQDVVEAVKRHILNMLHLQARPNITRPVPRAALLNALRKLHVGRVADDGSVQIEGEEEARGRGGRGGGVGGAAAAASRAGDSGDAQETTEIITFAEAGECKWLVCVCVCEHRFVCRETQREKTFMCVDKSQSALMCVCVCVCVYTVTKITYGSVVCVNK